MTNTNKGETFESNWNEWFESIKENDSNFKWYNDVIKRMILKFKQLHDSDISKSRLTIICLNNRIEQLLKNLNQKDKEIKELQAEIEFQRDLLSEPCNECKKKIERLKQWHKN